MKGQRSVDSNEIKRIEQMKSAESVDSFFTEEKLGRSGFPPPLAEGIPDKEVVG